MHRLVGSLVSEMGGAYQELVRAQPLIEETLLREETRFRQTLEKGLKLLDEATGDLAEGDTVPGETAFKLYDTYGFPYDLTEDALRSRGLTVDRAGFDAAMAEQKAAARAAWKGSGEKASDEIWFDIAEKAGNTEFIGYSSTEGEGEVLALVKDGVNFDSATAGETVTNLAMRSRVMDAVQRVREGFSLAKALRADSDEERKPGHVKLFPPVLINLIASGEATGKMPEMLDRAADIHAREAERGGPEDQHL